MEMMMDFGCVTTIMFKEYLILFLINRIHVPDCNWFILAMVSCFLMGVLFEFLVFLNPTYKVSKKNSCHGYQE